jgi:hypothetical protein
MHKLRESKDGRIYFDDGHVLYSFNGTPHRRWKWDSELDVVGQAPSLTAWQQNPAKYGPDYVVAQVITWEGDEHTESYIGNTWADLVAWAKEQGATISPNRVLFGDSDRAREAASCMSKTGV